MGALLQELPQETFETILDYLPLSSIQILGATCKAIYEKTHGNEAYWAKKLRREEHLSLTENFGYPVNLSGVIRVGITV